MRPIHLFYSWQSDRDGKICGNFIRIALEAAIQALKDEHAIEIRLDSDTADVPGTPPVSETILRKIRECEIFVGDVTFVGQTANGKQLPNPNVMIEFGYARGVLTDQQILSAMNTAFGPAEDLPFDLAHLRHPTSYSLEEGVSDRTRRERRSAFAKKLVPRLKAMAEKVLEVRAAVKPRPDVIASARALLTSVMQMNGRGETPAIVAGPKLIMQLITTAAGDGAILVPARVNGVRSKFLPAAYRESWPDTNMREWSDFDPPQSVQGKPNPEARWYMRVLRSGALDAAIMIGARIDDDKDILVDAAQLEARIVEMAERMGRVAEAIGLDGPLVIHASLEGTEDVRLMGRQRASRPLRMPFVDLGTIDLPSVSAITIENLRPLLDTVWLTGGFGDGSPLFSDSVRDGDRKNMLAAPEAISGRAWR
ncbi:hypothetical protein SAMN05428983_4621 [Agrobacterium fabrum]|uniref:Uncharacterized protein n=1 Tax=Agrobacterium fabrum TaxID=1176649 RepID=A0A7Z7BRT7_9HYPH|nr:hypothetical protein [Agrobacterium fabrum]SDK33404.1 hypothetical protein SAMN05428983_4621 [Agrobacterium fabrum]